MSLRSSRQTQTNAKIGQYVGYDAWNLTTTNGSTIQTALDYAMTLHAGDETASELYPEIVAVGAIYGDAGGAYAAFMAKNAGTSYPADAQFLWNQPFSDSGLVKAVEASSGSGNGSTVLSGADSGAAPTWAHTGGNARTVGTFALALAAVALLGA